MKVFVYSKKTSKKIAEIKEVISVTCFDKTDSILILTESGETLKFDCKDVKTTCYQN